LLNNLLERRRTWRGEPRFDIPKCFHQDNEIALLEVLSAEPSTERLVPRHRAEIHVLAASGHLPDVIL
jgi:hypothetical protein